MATSNSTKTKKSTEFKLPKFLKLNKGTMWFDTSGPNSSGIRLYKTTTKFIGRGFISDAEYTNYKEDGYSVSKDIKVDKNDNASSQHGQYGLVDIEDKSYFDTTKIDKSNISNIITAYNNNILIAFDPDNVVVPVERKIKRNFSYKKGSQNGTDGDIIFTGKNKQMYDKLNNAKHDDLVSFIKNAPFSAKNNIMDLYDYELSGYNRLNRPRATILDALRAKLNTFAPSMSAISVNDDE